MERAPGEEDAAHERTQVEDLVKRFFLAIDEKRWDDLPGFMGEKVLFDESSVKGGRPSRMSGSRVVERLRGDLGSLTATHHQIGNLLANVEGDEAAAFCYLTATYYFPAATGGQFHTLVGTYDFHLARGQGERWSFDAVRFNLKFEDGNPQLSQLAKRGSRTGRSNQRSSQTTG